jgi:hypothetical protein
MRQLLARVGLGMALLTPAAGCNLLPIFSPGGRDNIARPVATRTPDATALVKYMNDNAALVQAVRCNRVAIDCKQGRQSIGLDGLLICQKPKNFRLKAQVLGSPAVDIGSNSEEFWYWIKEGKPPYVFHCSYADLGTGRVELPFPFQPDMLVAALGIAEYDPAGKYEVRPAPSGKYLELIETTRSSQGEPVHRVTVFASHQVPAGQPQVLAHVLRDSKGKLICQANIHAVQVERTTRVPLPTKVTLEWPAQELKMTLSMSDLQPVNLQPEQSARMFSRGELEYATFDLARRVVDTPDGVRRAGGTLPRR